MYFIKEDRTGLLLKRPFEGITLNIAEAHVYNNEEADELILSNPTPLTLTKVKITGRVEQSVYENILFKLLGEGLVYEDIVNKLKECSIRPNSLSSIKKAIRVVKRRYKAKTPFHLASILNHGKNDPIIKEKLSEQYRKMLLSKRLGIKQPDKKWLYPLNKQRYTAMKEFCLGCGLLNVGEVCGIEESIEKNYYLK